LSQWSVGPEEGAGRLGFVTPAASSFAATPVELRSEHLDRVRYNEHGLVAAIVQDIADGAVLMMAWMNADTLRTSLTEGRTVFWSRSREEVWRKGDTSGDRQFVRRAFYDCDGDTLLFLVDQEGRGACHTGARTCFYRSFDSEDSTATAENQPSTPWLDGAAS
jgi:phosphoribosyl-AMP cyclohydrolase